MQSEDWADTRATVVEACSAAACGSQDQGYHLSRAYKAFAGKAEAELAVLTGAELRRMGTRGGVPELTSVNTLSMDQQRPPGKLDEVKQAKEKAACWKLAACRLEGLRVQAGRIFPGMPAMFVGGPVLSTLGDSEDEAFCGGGLRGPGA